MITQRSLILKTGHFKTSLFTSKKKGTYANEGFTLIEIIVVLVILGILSTIALPNLFSWIEKSRAPEAELTMKTLAEDLDACYMVKGWSASGPDPCLNAYGTTVTTQNFNISIAKDANANNPSYFMIATYTGDPGGGSTVTFCPDMGGESTDRLSVTNVIIMCSDTKGNRELVGFGIFQGAV